MQSANPIPMNFHADYFKEKNTPPEQFISKISTFNPNSNLAAFQGEEVLDNGHYSRLYPLQKSHECNDLRKILFLTVSSVNDTKPWKKLGEECNRHFKQPSELFKTIHSLKNTDKERDSCYQNALTHFSAGLEKISDLPFEEIKAQCEAYGILYIIDTYFESVREPCEGNLVLYSDEKTPHHCGIYTKNCHVESKWNRGATGKYVFEHELFFLPSVWGNKANFYRLKQFIPCVSADNFFPEHEKFVYKSTPANDFFRKQADSADMKDLIKQFPELKCYHNVQFHGICDDFAFGKVLKTYKAPDSSLNLFKNQEFLDHHFTPVQQPKNGDLAVYYSDEGETIEHYGVCTKDHQIESKWGLDPICKHPPFFVPMSYGNLIRYYRLKPGYA